MANQNESWKFPWYLIFVFFSLSVGIITTGYYYYKSQETYIRKEKQNELSAIIALKIDQIITWRQERIDYANTVMDDPFLATRVKDFFKGRAKPVIRAQILERLTTLCGIPIPERGFNRSAGQGQVIGPGVQARTWPLSEILG